MKYLQNAWKAKRSSFIGLLIPIITGMSSQVIDGSISWKAVMVAAVPALTLVFTDFMKEVQKEMEESK